MSSCKFSIIRLILLFILSTFMISYANDTESFETVTDNINLDNQILSQILQTYSNSWSDHGEIIAQQLKRVEINKCIVILILQEARNEEEYNYVTADNYTEIFNLSRALLLFLKFNFTTFEIMFLYYFYGMTKYILCNSGNSTEYADKKQFKCEFFEPWSVVSPFQKYSFIKADSHLNDFDVSKNDFFESIAMVIDTRESSQMIIKESLKKKLWHSYEVIDMILYFIRESYRENGISDFIYLLQYNQNQNPDIFTIPTDIKYLNILTDPSCFTTQSQRSIVSYQESEYYQTSQMLFLSNDYWITISDIVIHEFRNMQEVITELNSITRSSIVIFIDPICILRYVDNLLSLKYSFVLISASNTPFAMPYFKYPQPDTYILSKIDALLNCSNLIQWYAKNICLHHNKLAPIPLGPYFNIQSNLFFAKTKQKENDIYSKHFLSPYAKISNSSLKTNLLYFNFNLATSYKPYYSAHNNFRHKVYNALVKNNFSYADYNKNRNQYLSDLSTYRYCISPPGIGIDCFRTWECLMVGTIPILIHSPLDSLYDDLPVLIINIKDIHEITEEYLNQKYKDILKNKDKYNFEKLYTPYWKNEILSQTMKPSFQSEQTASPHVTINESLYYDYIFVTAFYDIGREKWGEYGGSVRTAYDYLSYFDFLVQMHIPLVIFIDDRYFEYVVNSTFHYRKIKKGFENISTHIISINEDFLNTHIKSWSYNKIQENIMSRQDYQELSKKRRTPNSPETLYPAYNSINHAKIDFIHYVMQNLTFISVHYYGWIDFGYFRNQDWVYPFKLNKILLNQKINFIQHAHLNSTNDIDPRKIFVEEDAKIGGGFWFGEKKSLLQFRVLYHNCLDEYHYVYNIADDDQAVMLYCITNYHKKQILLNQSFSLFKLWKNTHLLKDSHNNYLPYWGWFVGMIFFNENLKDVANVQIALNSE